MKLGTVSFAGEIRSGITRRKLSTLMQTDFMTLLDPFFELDVESQRGCLVECVVR